MYEALAITGMALILITLEQLVKIQKEHLKQTKLLLEELKKANKKV